MTLSDFIQQPVGTLPSGRYNTITDVPGVTVGQVTLADGAIQTGISVIKTHEQDPFLQKTPAAVNIINGFGKSVGLVQIEELGVLDTPIALTNTFSVSTVAMAQIKACINTHPQVGREWSTVNPLVFECNDGYLNDIQAFAITEQHYLDALLQANTHVAQGAVGAGRGMSSFGVKGGIGSASRCIPGTDYIVGALVLSNFGKPEQLRVHGLALGAQLASALKAQTGPEKGSIIIVIGTNAPLDGRQLKRIAKRAGSGLAKTGSVYGHGSGDIALAFTNAYTIPRDPQVAMPSLSYIHEDQLDTLFQAASDATEQAILNALIHAETVYGRNQHQRHALLHLSHDWRIPT